VGVAGGGQIVLISGEAFVRIGLSGLQGGSTGSRSIALFLLAAPSDSALFTIIAPQRRLYPRRRSAANATTGRAAVG
jgi:hypothetical protein